LINVIFIEKNSAFLRKIKTFLSDPKLLNGSVRTEEEDEEVLLERAFPAENVLEC